MARKQRNLSPASMEARKLCEQWPGVASKTIAERLAKAHPLLYRSVEHARQLVRWHRGERGKQCRKKVDKIIPTTKFQSPPTDAKPIAPYEFTTQGAGLLVADLHLPYHDPGALDIAINYAISHKTTDFLILLGDTMDAYQLSRFNKDPQARSWPEEIAMTKALLAQLAGIFGVVVFKAGNHEVRYDDYMRMKAPALIGVPNFEYATVMGFEEIGAQYVNWNQVVHVGEHLTLLHGHEYGRSFFNPVNAARGLFLRAKSCAVCAHQHSTSHHDEPNIRDVMLATWSIGCLCDLHPEYAPLNKWNHGFGTLHYNGGNDWDIANYRIIDGKVRTG